MTFGHVILLAPVPVSHDTDGIISGNICLAKDDWNEAQQDNFGDVIPVLASHDANSIINNTFVICYFKLIKD